jgi:RNA polymerase sigma-70 factor (ECF subfamily)
VTLPFIVNLPPPDTAEFEALLTDHQVPLLRFIKSIVPNHHEAEDLLQRTNLILWQKREGFATGSNFRAWSFTIARLEALNQLRQQRRDQRVFTEHPDPEPAAGLPPLADDPDPAPLLALRDCFRRLPSRDQELLMMRYATDRTLNDYAKSLNRSPGTLKARLFQIREHLRKSIEDHLRNAERPALTS